MENRLIDSPPQSHLPRLATFTDDGADDRLFDEFDGDAFKAVGPAQPPPPPIDGYLGRSRPRKL